MTRLREELRQDRLQKIDNHASKIRFVKLGVLAEVVKRVGNAMFADVCTKPLEKKLHWLQSANTKL